MNQGDDLQTVDYMVERLDAIGSPTSRPHYAVGQADATCTPSQWTKQVASHWGTRNGTIVCAVVVSRRPDSSDPS